MNIVDSCGWLEYFADTELADYYAPALEDTENLIIPTICILEVFKKILLQRDESAAFHAIALMQQGNVIDLDVSISMSAAKLGTVYQLPLADSIIYATAQRYQATVWTQDPDFKDLPRVKYITNVRD